MKTKKASGKSYAKPVVRRYAQTGIEAGSYQLSSGTPASRNCTNPEIQPCQGRGRGAEGQSIFSPPPWGES